MSIYRIWLVDDNDASYSCDYTVAAESEEAAKVFAESHNPGKRVALIRLEA